MVRSGMKREVQIIAEWNGDMSKQNEVVTGEWTGKEPYLRGSMHS